MRKYPPNGIMVSMKSATAFLTCQIRLHGRLDAERAGWLPELSIHPESNGNTLLEGSLPDQAALLGVLFRIHNLNLQILSVMIQPSHPLELPHGIA
jgi:hypothetical protein